MTPHTENIQSTLAKAIECLARDPKRAERLLGDVQRLVRQLAEDAPTSGASLPEIPFGPAFIDAYRKHYIAWGEQCFAAGAKLRAASEPVGKVVLFGEDLKEVSWRQGKLPPSGTVLYAAPQASAPVADESPMAKMAEALREKARQEQRAYQDRRDQATEWGPMPVGTEADDPSALAALADGLESIVGNENAKSAAVIIRRMASAPEVGEAQPVAYRAWFDQDNGARWLFTLWPEEERLDVQWEPLYAAPQASAEARNAALEDAGQVLDRLHDENRQYHTEFRQAAIAVRALKSAPAAEPCRTDVCKAAQRDGVLCANDACDIATGVRSAEDSAKGAGDVREPSPTKGMTIAQRILHVGGRNNKQGYVEFGSTQAVEALVRQVLRDLPIDRQQRGGDAEDAERWRWATALDDNAEMLHSIVISYGGDQAKINARADAYRDAMAQQRQEGA